MSLMEEIDARNVSVPKPVEFRRRPLDSTKECKILLDFVDYFDNLGQDSPLKDQLSFKYLCETVNTSMNSNIALSPSEDIECGISKNRWQRSILGVMQLQQLNKKQI